MKKKSMRKPIFFVSFLLVIFGLGIVISSFTATSSVASPIKFFKSQNTQLEPKSANTNPTNNEWSMFHGNLNHTGAIETNPKTSNSFFWNTGGIGVSTSPLVANGFLYECNYNGLVFCMNATTGVLEWNYTTNNTISTTPAIADGVVYVVDDGGIIYKLNAFNGTVELKHSISSDPIITMESTISISYGFLYVCLFYELYCFNTTTGNLKWDFITKNTYGGASSPTISNGRVYVGSSDNYVYCINAYDGTPYWSYQVSSDYQGPGTESTPALANGLLYIGTGDGNFYCLNASTGAFEWKSRTSTGITNSPAVSNGFVYIDDDDGDFYCFDALTGNLAWNCSIETASYSSPAVSNGRVYVMGNWGYHLFCLNASTGNILWKYKFSPNFQSSPAIWNGMVYIGGYDYIYCFPMILLPTPSHSISGMRIGITLSVILITMALVVFRTKKQLS